MHRLLLALSALVDGALSASQGFYLLAPFTAQLLLTDLDSGAQTPVGAGLPPAWQAPADCTPTAIEQTGKWAYSFARPAGAPPAATPWSVVAMELRDGSIRKAYELPAAFPPSLPACAHALAEDGGWHAYVAAVTRDAASPRLLLWRFTFTWPFSNETLPLLDVPLAALGMGGAPATLTLAVSNFTAWVALERGLVGVDLATRLPSRRLPLAGGEVRGLQYDVAGAQRRVVGVLAGGGSPSLLAFVDSGQGTPEAQLVPVAARVAPGAAGWAALANDRAQLVVLERGRAVALALGSGAVVANVSACSSSGQCAIACVYEPFVFA
jgi:hypothetical protein